MKKNTIALIGGGNLGGTLAHLIALKNLGDVVLIDIDTGIAQGKTLDISQASYLENININLTSTQDYSVLTEANIIIITAGIPRKPGMNRDDLKSINAKIITTIAWEVKKYAPEAFVIVITNPLDAMVDIFYRQSGLPSNKVVGMAGALDTSRFQYFLSKALNVSVSDIQTVIMGGHGDSMVPLENFTSVAGIPLSEIVKTAWLSKQTLANIIQKTRDGGGEIVSLLKSGSAFYAPASAAIAMTEAYIYDKRKIFSCSAYLTGEYNVKDMYVGVPAIIGANGVARVIELPLNAQEQKMFELSVAAVRKITSTN